MAGVVLRASGLGVLTERSQLAVWGDPIAHSRSPQLHSAAYEVLGLDWTYERRRVREPEFADALAGLDHSWRGLSVTYPLKTVAHLAAHTRDRRAALTGAVNTLLLADDGPHGFNTDVGGIVGALRENGVAEPAGARIVGAGATATSALVALSEIGARHVEIVARRPEAVARLSRLGQELGVIVRPDALTASTRAEVPITIATLPGDAVVSDADAASLAATGGMLLDVVYGSWPTALSQAWSSRDSQAISGLAMLVHQAVLQIRIFLTGSLQDPLPGEPTVLAAMRRAVMRD